MLFSKLESSELSLRVTVIMERRDAKLVLRGQIVELLEQGRSIRSIADELGISTPTVMKWKKRHAETGNLTNLRKYCHKIYIF